MLRRLFDRLRGTKAPEDTPVSSEAKAPGAVDETPPEAPDPDPPGDAVETPPHEQITEDNAPDAPVDPEAVKAQAAEAIRTVYDPEIPVNVYELGLIYDLSVDEAGTVDIKMTLTAPACPAAGFLPGQVESVVQGVPGVSDVRLELVWDPPWGPDRMSDAAKLELGML